MPRQHPRASSYKTLIGSIPSVPRRLYSAHTMIRFCLAIAAVLATSVAILKVFAGSPGELDTTFGVNGKLTANIGVADITIQTDGKIIAVGDLNGDFAVTRYNVDGTLDSTFGVGGQVTTDFFSDSDGASSVVIQADNKIVVGGGATSLSTQLFALVRYNPNGSLDTTFGSGGKVTTIVGTGGSSTEIALQADGKIVAAGFSFVNNNSDFALVRYNANGSLDTTFDSDGKVTTNFGDQDLAWGVTIQLDNKIVVAGTSRFLCGGCGTQDAALARYNPNGSLDSTFGSGGQSVENLFVDINQRQSHDEVTSVVVKTNGQIIVAGGVTDQNGNQYFALAAYNPNGMLDRNFGFNGVSLFDFTINSLPELYNDLAIQTDGKIVAVGQTIGFAQPDKNFALARYDSLGHLDFTFPNGVVTTDFGGDEAAASVAIQADGKIVVAGTKEFANGFLARYFSSFTQPDLSLTKTHSGNFGRSVNNNYTLNVQNVGTGSTTGTVTVTDTLPTGLTFVSATGSGWACSHSSGTVTCTNPNSLGVNVSTNITLTVFVSQSAPTSVINTASVATAGDSNLTNNTANDQTSIPQPGTLQFSGASFSQSESGGTATITVTRTGGSAGAATAQFSNPAGGTATGGASCVAGVDYITPSGPPLSWADGDASNKTFSITLCNDNIFEGGGGETVNLALSNATGASLGSPTAATLTITEDDTQPSINITDISQSEGNSGTTNFNFNVTLSHPTAQPVTVNFATADGTATTANNDYQARVTTPLNFSALQTSQVVTVLVNGDSAFESNETFVVNLSGASGATISDSQGVGTIQNDDPLPQTGTVQFSGTSFNQSESGGTATITVTRTGGSSGAASVQFSNPAGGTAIGGASCTAGVDYITPSGPPLSWADGDASNKTFSITLCNDNIFEGGGGETVNLELNNAQGATLGSPTSATLTITEDDTQPSISITDVTQSEGNTSFNFNVSLGHPTTQTVMVNFATANGTADATDYQPINSTQLSFAPLQTSKQVTVLVTGDTTFEPDETFFVNLSGASGATIADGQGMGTIVNDDGPLQPGTLQFSAASFNQTENGGTATITVTRTGGTSGPASVQFANAAGGTATSGASCGAGVDYITPSGALNWAAGDASTQIFLVTFCNDNIFEGNETVNLALSNVTGATLGSPGVVILTISNDDNLPSISINDVTQAEGNSGTANFIFTITLTNPTVQTVTFNYATANDTAIAGTDYQAVVATASSFNPGETSKQVTVAVNGDTTFESGETFFVNLTSVTNALSGDVQGMGTIIADDPMAGNLKISGQVKDDTNRSISGVNMTLSLNGAPIDSQPSGANGDFTFNNLNVGGNYSVTPSSSSYSFGPASAPFNNITANGIANFVGTSTLLSIRGKVTDSHNVPQSNVSVALSITGSPVAPVTTDALGDYSFPNLAAGANYVVTPVAASGFFQPISQSFSNLTVNATANFETSPSIPGQCTSAVLNFAEATYVVGTGPTSIVSGDFNGDGFLDLATANNGQNTVSVLMNNGVGGFIPASQSPFPVGTQPFQVVAENFDGDQDLDLLTVNRASVSLLLGDGTGNFSAATNLPAIADEQKHSVAVGKLNNDNLPDLVVANYVSNTVTVLLNNGSGSFSSAGFLVVGGNPSAVALNYFDGDDKLDLVTANAGSSNISVFLGDGTGGFTQVPGSPFPVSPGTAPASIAVRALDLLPGLDLVLSDENSNHVWVMGGDGAGAFSLLALPQAGLNPFTSGVTADDFNGDYKQDLGVTNFSMGNLSVLLGGGKGNFPQQEKRNFGVGSGPRTAVTGDFNPTTTDLRPDLAVVNGSTNNVSVLLNMSQTCNGVSGASSAIQKEGASPQVAAQGLTLSGRILNANLNPLPGITVTLSGIAAQVTQADGNGNYVFANLVPAGNYSVTVQSPQYVFAPSRVDFLSLSSNVNYNFTAAPVAVPATAPVASDDFNSASRDTSKWNLGSLTQAVAAAVDPQIGLVQVNGQLVLRPLTQAAGIHHLGYVSTNAFDLNNGTATVEVVQAANGGADTIFALGLDSANYARFVIRTPDGGPVSGTAQLLSEVAIGGQTSAVTVPYDAAQHRYLRFRATGNVLRFETSANGVTFSAQRQQIMSQSLSAVAAELAVETAGPGNPGPTIVDNFQVANSTFQFSAPSYSVGEGEAVATITVTRSGGASDAATVAFASSDGTATQPGKYATAMGTLSFAPGESSKTFQVTIVDDALVTGYETVNLTLSNPMGAGLSSPGRAVLTIRENDTSESTSPVTVQFTGTTSSVNENSGHVTLTLMRTGSVQGTSSVDISTADIDNFTVGCADTVKNQGGAFGRCDFATVVSIIQFAPGETIKTIDVPIIDDVIVESPETFQVIVRNPSAATLGMPATATVTIQDNDAQGQANPIFSSPFFVRQHYLDFLSREPELAGFNAWLGVLNGCPNVDNLDPKAPSKNCDRILVSQSFFGSPEFQLKGFYVFRFYKVAFNRLPEYLEIVSDMSFVAGSTALEVFQRKAQLATNLTTRQEFLNAFGGLSNVEFVNALFARYQLTQIMTVDPQQPDGSLKVTLTAAELTNQLNSNMLTRAQVLRAIADSDQLAAAEFNNAFVAMQYYGYLRRKPEPAGFQSWLQVLQGGDLRNMINGFMNSQEYRLRFGP